jgi:hypothetical protein
MTVLVANFVNVANLGNASMSANLYNKNETQQERGRGLREREG